MDIKIENEIYQMWVQRIDTTQEYMKNAQDQQKLASFMVLPFGQNEVYISMLKGEDVYESCINSDEAVDFISGELIKDSNTVKIHCTEDDMNNTLTITRQQLKKYHNTEEVMIDTNRVIQINAEPIVYVLTQMIIGR